MKINWHKTRTWIAVLWALVCFSGWYVSVYVRDPVYVAESAIKIGSVGIFPAAHVVHSADAMELIYSVPVEETVNLSEILRAKYRVPEAKKQLTEMPHLFFIEERRGGVLRIRARGPEVSEVNAFLEDILSWIEGRHRYVFRDAREKINLRAEDVERRVSILLLKKAEEQLSRDQIAEGEEGVKDDLETLIATLTQIDFSRSRLKTSETEILLKPTAMERPVRPRPLVYLLAAIIVAIVGYIHTISLVILWESRRKLNSE